jgi:hypothetical protein
MSRPLPQQTRRLMTVSLVILLLLAVGIALQS